MNEEKLEKKMLATARLEARKQRIRNIRRRVAMFGASLALVFSGLIVGLQGVPVLLGSGQSTSTQVVKTDNPEQQAGASIVALATDLVTGSDNGSSRPSSSQPVTTSQS